MVPRSPGRQAFLKPEQDRPCPIDPSQSQRLEYPAGAAQAPEQPTTST